MRQNKGCVQSCKYKLLSDNPLEAARQILQAENQIGGFRFACMYVIPVYEKLTGTSGMMDQMKRKYKKMWKRKHPEEDGYSSTDFV